MGKLAGRGGVDSRNGNDNMKVKTQTMNSWAIAGNKINACFMLSVQCALGQKPTDHIQNKIFK